MSFHGRWTYTATHTSDDNPTIITIQTVPAYVTARRALALQYEQLMPATPRIACVALPGLYPAPYRPRTPDLFPIDLFQSVPSSSLENRMCTVVPAWTSVSVRDPENQVLVTIKTGAVALSTADIVLFLQHFVAAPLSPHAGLSPVVRESVEMHFISRCGAHGLEVWERYARGTPRFGCPTGQDLLLGRTVLWYLDVDIGGSWTAIVDVPRTPSW
ncbi:hypothetical protein B0H15DRAFT_932776 [Mycena belliarum]|uniref:Uncharacterized protein n=1 Tax=Mycena belliarum TaxID=1033014 RepID=A0AAD6TWH5_9AGAR|nr:hypothetical protein B0H15DRAFT_932776 [Mycena belliae]